MDDQAGQHPPPGRIDLSHFGQDELGVAVTFEQVT